MELDSEAPTVAHSGNRRVVRAGDSYIARREARDMVAVAHPDVERCRQILKERGRLRHLNRRRSVFATSGRLDAPVKRIGDQMHAVANSEHGNIFAEDPRW